MASVVFYFQVHQPFRLRRYSIFDSGTNYFDEVANDSICKKVAQKCYLPANRVILDRGYTGYQGGLHLMEDLLGAIVATR